MTAPATVAPVRAAGGVVWRRRPEGAEVLLVHRPRYDDWSLPKGKLLPGETEPEAALREVAEETGLECRMGPELARSEYVDRRRRPKTVRYWAMTPESGTFRPHDEIDEVRWLGFPAARSLLTYDRDRQVLGSLRTLVAPPLLLLRHAAAGDRDSWDAPDHLRPLSGKGRRQATALVETLRGEEVDAVLTSPYMRCVESVEPLARARRLAVATEEVLAEGADASAVVALLRSLAGSASVLCTHGDVVQTALEVLVDGDGLELPGGPRWAKGSVWALEPQDGRFVSARYLPPL